MFYWSIVFNSGSKVKLLSKIVNCLVTILIVALLYCGYLNCVIVKNKILKSMTYKFQFTIYVHI